MKKIAGVLFILLLFYSNVLGAEDVKKPSPAKDFEYDLNKEGTGVVIKKYLGKDMEVIIPEVIKTFPVVSIGNEAFRDDDLESVTIPDSVKEIRNEAFYNCKNLKTVILGKGVERIGYEAFYNSGLESITISDSVKEINRSAFGFCSELITLNILTIRKINYNGSIFYRCSNLSDESKAKIEATGYKYGFYDY